MILNNCGVGDDFASSNLVQFHSRVMNREDIKGEIIVVKDGLFL